MAYSKRLLIGSYVKGIHERMKCQLATIWRTISIHCAWENCENSDENGNIKRFLEKNIAEKYTTIYVNGILQEVVLFEMSIIL